jgi:hypothetical protein
MMDSTSAKALGIVLQVSTSLHQAKIDQLSALRREAEIGKLFMQMNSIEHTYFVSMMRMCAANRDCDDRCIGYIGALCSYFSFPRYTEKGKFTFDLIRENVLSRLFQLYGFKVCTYSNMPLDNDLAMIHILEWEERSRFQTEHVATTGPDGKVYYVELLPAKDCPNPQKMLADKFMIKY